MLCYCCSLLLLCAVSAATLLPGYCWCCCYTAVNAIHQFCSCLQFKLREALGRSLVSHRTSPSKRPRRHSPSPGRRSTSLSPTPKHHASESPHKKQRSRSPTRRGKHPKDASTRKSGNRGEGPFFRGCTGTTPSGICAVCLGRYEHNFSKCNSALLWDGTKGWARKNEQGRLATPEGLVLCFDWQLPKACASTAHTEKHFCSGCGDSKHGAQKCPRGEKA